MDTERRAPRTVGLVWFASAAPFLIEPFTSPGRLAGVSRAALAALPWIAWAGLPRARPSSAGGALLDLALCLPPIALGSWTDLASGIPRGDVVLVAASSALLVLALALAARWASRSRPALRAHAITWLVLVAGIPLLCAALELGGAPLHGPVPAWMAWVARASPIAWIVARLDASAVMSGPASTSAVTSGSVAALAGVVLLALALLAIGAAGARKREEIRA
jgi:hypothetical protein